MCWSCSWGDRLKARKSSIYAKQKSKSLRITSMKRWNFWAAFRMPKDIQGNSKRPKGVVMAVFWMSGWTGIWCYVLTRSNLEVVQPERW